MSSYSAMRARQQSKRKRRYACVRVRQEAPGVGPKLRHHDEIHVQSTGECRRWEEVRG